MCEKIDAHHHFWKYDPVQFGWIDDSMRRIRQDFLPEHLRGEIAESGVDGVVTVQAIQTLEESEWLLEFGGRHDFIRGVVGWVPLADPRVGEHLENYSRNTKFRGVRHILQAEPDERFMLRNDFNRGISLLKDFGLAYDILIFERHLPQTIEFVDRHPDQVFVVDHLAKPRVKDGLLSPWRQHIVELARRPNIFCKLSGLVTEADYLNWTVEQLEPFLDVALNAFSPRRLMFGSDWPVCLVATSYIRWKQIISEFISRLSEDEQRSIWGASATRAYNLGRSCREDGTAIPDGRPD